MSPKYIAAAILAGATALPALGSPFGAANCQLTVPPSGAGEDIAFGEFAKIYPRSRDFPDRYTGCQITWVQANSGWDVQGITYFENGEAVSYWSPPPGEMLCQYRSGRIVLPSEQRCPNHAVLGAKSMAPGCINKILDRGNIKGCKFE